jgi:hypothetical protein
VHDIILVYLLKAFFSDEISLDNKINAGNAHGDVGESDPLITVENLRREFPNKHGILSFNINELNSHTFYSSQEYHNLNFFQYQIYFLTKFKCDKSWSMFIVPEIMRLNIK